MIKIQIKSIYGSILFEYESEQNTLKDTIIKAVNSDADLTDADLRGADLRGADLRGAKIKDITIKKATIITGLYDYVVIPIISKDNIKWVKMGCYLRTVEDWDKDFWNNNNEFPNNGSEKSNMRLFAYETAKKWFEIINEN